MAVRAGLIGSKEVRVEQQRDPKAAEDPGETDRREIAASVPVGKMLLTKGAHKQRNMSLRAWKGLADERARVAVTEGRASTRLGTGQWGPDGEGAVEVRWWAAKGKSAHEAFTFLFLLFLFSDLEFKFEFKFDCEFNI
jgi:hypothetical protein